MTSDLYIAMAGPHQIWQMQLAARRHRPLCRQRPRGHRRRPAAARRALRRGLCLVRPAQRPDRRRHLAVRGRQRRKLDPRRAVRSDAERAHRDRHSQSADGRLFTFGDVDGQGAAGPVAASAGRRLARRPALRRRHLQQQNQSHRSGPKTLPHAGRHLQAGRGRRSAAVRRAGRPEHRRRQALRGRHQQPRRFA